MKNLAPFFSWLQEAITHVWRFLLGVILLVLGAILLVLVAVASGFFYFITLPKKKQNIGEILQERGYFYKLVAIGIDILGNIIGGSFFNWFFLKEVSKFPFGLPGYKVSSLLELNFRLDKLNERGFWLKKKLDKIEKDHCKKSVAEDIERAEFLLRNT